MNKLNIAIGLLAIGLVASNAWWAYRMLDWGVTQTYANAVHEQTSELLGQALAILPLVAKENASRGDILAAARSPNSAPLPYEKDGFVWVGQLGLKFNTHGRLESAVAGPLSSLR
jgi:hypothetical protein